MINLIVSDVFNVDFLYIFGKVIVEGDKILIRNFLEIFVGLFEYFMEYVNDEGMKVCYSDYVLMKVFVNS